MPDQAIEFVHVRDKDTGVEKFIPAAKYEAQSDLWAKVGHKATFADAAPPVETTADSGGSKSGHKAAVKKEN